MLDSFRISPSSKNENIEYFYHCMLYAPFTLCFCAMSRLRNLNLSMIKVCDHPCTDKSEALDRPFLYFLFFHCDRFFLFVMCKTSCVAPLFLMQHLFLVTAQMLHFYVNLYVQMKLKFILYLKSKRASCLNVCGGGVGGGLNDKDFCVFLLFVFYFNSVVS